MTAEVTSTPYAALGGETDIQRLVQRFYALMDERSEAYTVRQMHPGSLQASAQSLFGFLSGWLGGPAFHIAHKGHPLAAERPVSDLGIKVLGTQGGDALERAGAVYVADTTAMPGIVTRTFALLKLRELPFQIGLAREVPVVTDPRRRPGAATLLTRMDGQVAQVRYAPTEAELRQALGLAT